MSAAPTARPTVTISGTRDPSALPRMVGSKLAERLRAAIASQIKQSLLAFLDLPDTELDQKVTAAVAAFYDLYEQRPVKDNKGGSGFNDSLWLFVMARLLSPRFIVESGVHKGHSTWLFRQACPAADIHCFDIDLSKLVYRDPAASYHESDWMDHAVTSTQAQESLIFFDDHISHARRLREAYDRGFRQLLLDDNFPAYNVYATGGPPVPTLAMITDSELSLNTEINWLKNGKTYSYIYCAEDVVGVSELIEAYRVLPDLAPLTRYSPGSGLTFVRLIP